MLTETFIASISSRLSSTSTTHPKDSSIFTIQLQPRASSKSSAGAKIYKKSLTASHCLATSPQHIFAAQSDKAVVHVYGRDGAGALQTVVPFREKITSIVLARNGHLLVCGTETGNLLLWETLTGRVAGTEEAHLGAVTTLAADHMGFVLSGAEDGAVHVWNLEAVLAFGDLGKSMESTRRAPTRSLRGHRENIVDLVVGSGKGWKNIAATAALDGSVIIWDYHQGIQLRTILLPAAPTALALDPCDRAFVCGFADGSALCVDFFGMDQEGHRVRNPIWDEEKQTAIVQLGEENKWKAPDDNVGGILCLQTSHDGTKVITGHSSGHILVWDVPSGRYISHLTGIPLPGPVSNLNLLPVAGFLDQEQPRLEVKEVVKPRFGELDSNDGQVPANYKIAAQMTGLLPFVTSSVTPEAAADLSSEISNLLTHPLFPEALLSESIADMQAVRNRGPVPQAVESDSMALDSTTNGTSKEAKLEEENAELKKRLEGLQKLQKTAFKQMDELRKERDEMAAAMGRGTSR